jgi:hypothetical protein
MLTAYTQCVYEILENKNSHFISLKMACSMKFTLICLSNPVCLGILLEHLVIQSNLNNFSFSEQRNVSEKDDAENTLLKNIHYIRFWLGISAPARN